MEQISALIDCFIEPVLIVAADGRILLANGSAKTLFAAVDQRLVQTVLVQSPAEIERYLQACLAGETCDVPFLSFNTASQEIVFSGCSLQAEPFCAAILLRGNTSRDAAAILQSQVTLLHQKNIQLLASQAHAQAVLDTAVDGIITIDEKGTILTFNRAAESIFGYTAGEVTGKNVQLLMPQPYRDEHDTYLHNYLTTGVKKIIGIGREVWGLRKDGSQFPLDLAVSEIKTGHQHHFTGIIRDISERKAAEEQLRRGEEEARQQRERLAHFDRLSTMGEMASGLAHEINQPLTAISSYARACHRLLQAGKASNEALMEVLDKIHNQAQRAGEVIHRLRAFVKKQITERSVYDLNELINDTLVLAETDIHEHGFSIVTRFSPRPLMVMVDPVQIQQVVLNLIRNALDAMNGYAQPGASVEVTVAPLTDDLHAAHIAVTDRGRGIPDEFADKVFNPFFTTKSLGTGIGLAISRTIVSAHGGRLWFENNCCGGTTMQFTLPLLLSTANQLEG